MPWASSTPRPPIVYALHSGDGVFRYVGSTTLHLAQRINIHVQSSKRKGHAEADKMKSWIASLGKKPEAVILEVCTREELRSREAYWIARMWAEGKPLLNTKLLEDTPQKKYNREKNRQWRARKGMRIL